MGNMEMLNQALMVSGWGLAWGFLCSAILYFCVKLLGRQSQPSGK